MSTQWPTVEWRFDKLRVSRTVSKALASRRKPVKYQMVGSPNQNKTHALPSMGSAVRGRTTYNYQRPRWGPTVTKRRIQTNPFGRKLTRKVNQRSGFAAKVRVRNMAGNRVAGIKNEMNKIPKFQPTNVRQQLKNLKPIPLPPKLRSSPTWSRIGKTALYAGGISVATGLAATGLLHARAARVRAERRRKAAASKRL